MQIQAAGAHASAPVLPISKPDAVSAESRRASFAAQIDEAMLKHASIPELAHLLSGSLRAHAPEASDALLRDAISAVQRGEPLQALDAFTRLAKLDPARGEALVSHPDLASIRGELDHLLGRFTLAARLGAETQIAHAIEAIPVSGGSNPQALLQVANQFYNAGGYANYTNAAAVAQAAIDASIYPAALAAPTGSELDLLSVRARRNSYIQLYRVSRTAIGKLWLRAPLLVLLLGWFAAGLSAGAMLLLVRAAAAASGVAAMLDAVFDAWGLGFLALVGFGFYMRVRNVRFRAE